MSGVMAALPVDDDEFDDDEFDADEFDADPLADALAFTLADDDALVLGAADVRPEGEAATACVGEWLAFVQVGLGVAWFVSLAVPPEVEPGLGLRLGDTVGAGVALGLLLGLTVALGLVVALTEALALGLVVLPRWLPLDDVAGAVPWPVALLAALAVAAAWDGCADGDAHAPSVG